MIMGLLSTKLKLSALAPLSQDFIIYVVPVVCVYNLKLQ